MSGNKGQIFTLDVLAAILGITILLGVTVQYQTIIKNRGSGYRYREMKTISSDAAQIAVKNTTVEQANTLDSGKKDNLGDILEKLTGEKYNYKVKGALNINPDKCQDSEEIANTRRLVKNESGEPQTLTVVICNG